MLITSARRPVRSGCGSTDRGRRSSRRCPREDRAGPCPPPQRCGSTRSGIPGRWSAASDGVVRDGPCSSHTRARVPVCSHGGRRDLARRLRTRTGSWSSTCSVRRVRPTTHDELPFERASSGGSARCRAAGRARRRARVVAAPRSRSTIRSLRPAQRLRLPPRGPAPATRPTWMEKEVGPDGDRWVAAVVDTTGEVVTYGGSVFRRSTPRRTRLLRRMSRTSGTAAKPRTRSRTARRLRSRRVHGGQPVDRLDQELLRRHAQFSPRAVHRLDRHGQRVQRRPPRRVGQDRQRTGEVERYPWVSEPSYGSPSGSRTVGSGSTGPSTSSAHCARVDALMCRPFRGRRSSCADHGSRQLFERGGLYRNGRVDDGVAPLRDIGSTAPSGRLRSPGPPSRTRNDPHGRSRRPPAAGSSRRGARRARSTERSRRVRAYGRPRPRRSARRRRGGRSRRRREQPSTTAPSRSTTTICSAVSSASTPPVGVTAMRSPSRALTLPDVARTSPAAASARHAAATCSRRELAPVTAPDAWVFRSDSHGEPELVEEAKRILRLYLADVARGEDDRSHPA